MRRSMVVFVSAVLSALAIAGASPLPQQAAKPATTAAPPVRRTAPKLVVILVVDQFRADYVARFSKDWTGGLRRLLDEGATFPQAAFPYMATITCVGHTSIATGSFPSTHGIVANDIWDRATGKPGNCTEDPDATLVSYGEPVKGAGTSTRKLLVPALPDELRAQLPTPPRIVSLSMKDYTATMLAGRRADAVAWGNNAARALVTSSAFAKAPAPWVADFVKARPIDGDFGKTWTKVLPDSAYLFADDVEGERPTGKWTRTFPHVLKGADGKPDADFYTVWEASPFSDAYLGTLAEASIDALKLGQRDATDYLAISFSALDLVGHNYGPRSQEVQDLLVHLDRTIGSLLAHLDRKVGRGSYVLALAGDHGVSPVPEQMAALGLNGGRVLTPDLFARIEKALEPFLGPGKKVARNIYNELFFEPGVYDKLRANPEAMRAALEAARSMPGIMRVFSNDQLASAQGTPLDELQRLTLASFHPARSGDFIVIPQPYHQFTSDPSRHSGTTHGSPYWYDRRVPLILLGKGIKGGTYTTAAAPTDIAPTLAYLCGITLPAADGRVLNEALTTTDTDSRRLR
jgi:predicted AlkP superfamily pyrophosphatase or phosphodiesterase